MELHVLSTYDEDGRLLSRVEESGAAVSAELWTYDELGRPVQHTSEYRPPKGDAVYDRETVTWEYDRWGDLVREYSENGTGQNEVLYTYDDRGNLLRRQNGDLWEAWEYDGEDFLIRESGVGVDGDLRVTEYTRDEAGHTLLERNLKDGRELSTTAYTWEGDLCVREVSALSGSCETVREYAYDARGNLLLMESNDPEKPVETYAYTYDEAGRLLRREYRGGVYDWGEAYNIYTCEYDGAGRTLREAYESDNGDTWSVEYAYNEAGDLARTVRVEWNKYRTETVYTYDPGAGRMTSVSTQTQAEAD